MQYHLIVTPDQQPIGPFELNELTQHGLNNQSLVWCEGMADWAKATDVPPVAALLNSAPEPATQAAPSQAYCDTSATQTYYLAVNGQPQGPFTASQLREQGVLPTSMVWRQGMQAWAAISTIPELSQAVFGDNQSLYGYNPDPDNSSEDLYMPDQSPENIHPLTEPVSECPPTHLGIAIAAVILMFPFSIGVLVKSILVKVRWNERRYGDAVWLSRTAKTTGITCIIIGAVIIAAYFVLLMSVS